MTCPVCGEPTGVIDFARDCEQVYRRRKCKVCGYAFFTTESETASSKRDFALTKYQYQKAIRDNAI